jgi:hypothetical protein
MAPVKSERVRESVVTAARRALALFQVRPVATPPPSVADDSERETSTNAQPAGASEEPWPGNE